jgi:hypothetical protein
LNPRLIHDLKIPSESTHNDASNPFSSLANTLVVLNCDAGNHRVAPSRWLASVRLPVPFRESHPL